jgi:hypothetical protein
MAAAFFKRACCAKDQHLPRWRRDGRGCERVHRVKIFGSTETVNVITNPCVQVHGPGFSKIILGDDEVDNWEKYLDIMVDSVYLNSGRGCINCSGVDSRPRRNR